MRIIGIGDNVVDKYLHLNKMFPGGNALNISVYASKMGHEAAYIGVFGNDEVAQHIVETLKEFNVDISRCRYYEGENGYAEVNLVEGDRVFVGGNKGGVSAEKPLKLDTEDLDYIKGYDLIHSSCYSWVEDQLPTLAKLSIPISYDFSNKIDNDYLKIVCPYLTFAFLSCGHLSEEQTKEKLVQAVDYGSELALGTRGEEGAVLFYNSKFYFQAADKVKALDTLGAGDSFIAAFLFTLMTEKGFNEEVITEAMKKGAKFAADTCLIQGAFGHGKNIS